MKFSLPITAAIICGTYIFTQLSRDQGSIIGIFMLLYAAISLWTLMLHRFRMDANLTNSLERDWTSQEDEEEVQ